MFIILNKINNDDAYNDEQNEQNKKKKNKKN